MFYSFSAGIDFRRRIWRIQTSDISRSPQLKSSLLTLFSVNLSHFCKSDIITNPKSNSTKSYKQNDPGFTTQLGTFFLKFKTGIYAWYRSTWINTNCTCNKIASTRIKQGWKTEIPWLHFTFTLFTLLQGDDLSSTHETFEVRSKHYIWYIVTYRPLGYERVYLLLC